MEGRLQLRTARGQLGGEQASSVRHPHQLQPGAASGHFYSKAAKWTVPAYLLRSHSLLGHVLVQQMRMQVQTGETGTEQLLYCFSVAKTEHRDTLTTLNAENLSAVTGAPAEMVSPAPPSSRSSGLGWAAGC